MEKVNVAVVGVGAVGVEILRILKQRKFPVNELKVFARSSRQIEVDGTLYDVEAIDTAKFDGIKIALFAGTEGEKGASVTYAQKFIDAGAVIVDNGADFRMNPDVPLVIPEVNKDKIAAHKGIIANPNCTTIQALVALGGIYKAFGLRKMVLTSFQAVSGAGKGACIGLWEETRHIARKNGDVEYDKVDKRVTGEPKGFAHQIAFNVIPQIGSFAENDFTTEEWKVVKETHKIYDNDKIKVSATCVRVPVFNAHSESIYFTPAKKVSLRSIVKVLKSTEGAVYMPDSLPMPLDVDGKDETFVGRLRKDPFEANSFWLWCVADNLRKGAALNAVQIAECLL